MGKSVKVANVPNGPAFSAYINNAQTVPATTDTKLAFNAEAFDTNACFDTSTYRFTPNVAGYYQINIGVQIGGTTQAFPLLYKNGSANKYGQFGASATSGISTLSALVYMNGTTDYLEAYLYTTVSNNTSTGQLLTYFDGHLARPA